MKDSNSTEDIVISGISGRFPESSNLEEFKQNLFNKTDMVTEDNRRWPPGIYNLPSRSGKLKNLSHFDASFFNVHTKQAEQMDPQLRILLEVTYEAIFDAGINPNKLRGSKTGVFIGITNHESLELWSNDIEKINSYIALCCCRSMLANRVSYSFDFKGPSCAIDTACSSSLFALHQAVQAIKNGDCESAIVGGVNLLLSPVYSSFFHKMGVLSSDGMCKTFDSAADGFVRSEAVVAVYLQKMSNAKRVYASILGIKTNNDGYKQDGITFPNGNMQTELICNTYKEFGVDPLDVAYIEAHGTGTEVGDPQEANSIANFFCKNREEPLLIGSVKSNMGHSEPVSGLCSIAKLLIAMESGLIPANLHYKLPNPKIPALIDGRFKVVCQHEKLMGDIVAASSFGFGGANTHLILKANPKKQQDLKSAIFLPRVVTVSGRTKESVLHLLEKVNKNRENEEFLGLINQIYKNNIPEHGFRGFSLLNQSPTVEISDVLDKKRPLWFLYSGMGSQWSKMGKDLMQIEIFRNSIAKSSKALKPHGINLEELLVNSIDSTFDNIINTFVTITAVQVALTDLLKNVHLEPDGIIGHSMGEIGCAYADGSLTAEQAVLISYSRAKAVFDSNLQPGLMAAVGLSWKEAKQRCPSEIVLACNNGVDNVTISGPKKAINTFVEELKKEKIFAKIVNSGNYAFHSKYIADAGPNLRKALDKIITNPKPRTKKWISSSIPESEWETLLAAQSSSAYFVNNLISPVLFYEALQHVQKNAIIVEVAPTGLLQAILRRTLEPEVTNISMLKKGYKDNLQFLLAALGKIYNAGAQPQFENLYPPVNFPVSRGTPMISSLIKWDHSIEWPVPYFTDKSAQSGQVVIEIDMNDETNQYLTGHTIDGRILFPATGYLILIWKALAKFYFKNYEQLPVIIENVKFQKATILPINGSVKFLINILDKSGEFEISDSESVLVSGKIHIPENVDKEFLHLPKYNLETTKDLLPLSNADIYKEFRLRGYEYKDIFCGISNADNKGLNGKLKWHNNWVSFLDTVLQFTLLRYDTRDLLLPIGLRRIVINPKQHLNYINNLSKNEDLEVNAYHNIGVVESGGIQVTGIKATIAAKKSFSQSSPFLRKYQFVPYVNYEPLCDNTDNQQIEVLNVMIYQIVENNYGIFKFNIVEFGDSFKIENNLIPKIKNIIENQFNFSIEAIIVTSELSDAVILKENDIKHLLFKDLNKLVDQNMHLVILVDVLTQNNFALINDVINLLNNETFLMLEEPKESFNVSKLEQIKLEVISIQTTTTKIYVLLKKPVKVLQNSITIQLNENNFEWIEPLKSAIKENGTNNKKIYVFSQGEELCGLVGMINCLRQEPGGANIRSVFIQDKNAEIFSLGKYEKQLRKDLVHNVLKNNVWGSYRHLSLKENNNNNKKEVKHAYVNTLTRGDLSSLSWIQSPLTNNNNKNTCSVFYSSLNFRDVMLASGKLAQYGFSNDLFGEKCVIGTEFSGIDLKGRRIMGMLLESGLATTVIPDPVLSWEVPEKWSLEQAATVPAVYATCYYALIERGKMQPGESILIHAGSGGVGLAAISICLHMGCKVFTTVGNQVKRNFLKTIYPELSDDCIGSSRDTSFEQLVMTQTNGKGVDLVLNSLASDLLQASIRCLTVGGRFLEIGKADMVNDSNLGMNVFFENTTFHGISFDIIFKNDMVKPTIKKYLIDGIASGAVQPLPTTVFTENEVETAFRYLASGKNIGKVVIKIRNEKNSNNSISIPKTIAAIPKTYYNPEKSYILVGGLGGFGLELTNWMIGRGATKLILTSRSGVKTGYQSLCLCRWKELGVNIKVSITDCLTLEKTQSLLEEANSLGPIGGIFNLAVVLRDALLENQTVTNFESVCQPKISTTKHLDSISRKLAPKLDYFVCFSSVSSGYGNPGQTNYGLANSAMERICEARQADKLPGLAIQYGLIGDVGIFVEEIGSNDSIVNGTVPQKLSSCLATMDNFLQQQSNAVVTSLVFADKHNQSKIKAGSVEFLINAVGNILGIKNVEDICQTTCLTDLGMDSLMSTEIKQLLERNMNLVLSTQEIRALTFGKLMELDKK